MLKQKINVSLNELEGHVGKVAKCGIGRIAVITGKDKTVWSEGKEVWVGIGLDGEPWSSSKPEILADTLSDYLKQQNSED